MNVLVDTNVILDVLLERKPFYADALRIVSMAETGEISGWISAITYPTVFYIVRKAKGSNIAREAVKRLEAIFKTAPVDSYVIKRAVEANFRDFEASELPIYTPPQFLENLK